jgi:hypothetical protein
VTVDDYLKATGKNLHQLSQESKVTYSVLHGHVKHKKKLSREIAERLQASTGGAITAIEAMYPPDGETAPKPKRVRRAGKAA